MGGAALRAVLPLCLLLAACGPGDMAEQDRIEPFEEHGALVPPEGTIPRDAQDRAVELAVRPAADPAFLARGADRFAIFCAPCHGSRADGRGHVPSIPDPPDLLASHRDAAALVRVITEGQGAMPAYANRLRPRDRWAVAAHIERLRAAQRP